MLVYVCGSLSYTEAREREREREREEREREKDQKVSGRQLFDFQLLLSFYSFDQNDFLALSLSSSLPLFGSAKKNKLIRSLLVYLTLSVISTLAKEAVCYKERLLTKREQRLFALIKSELKQDQRNGFVCLNI